MASRSSFGSRNPPTSSTRQAPSGTGHRHTRLRLECLEDRAVPSTFTVTLSAAYDQAVTMSYGTVNGTATSSDDDYVARSGTLTFKPGETTKTITIEVKGDGKKEADEYFSLDLFGNSTNSLFTRSRGTGTILNDD